MASTVLNPRKNVPIVQNVLKEKGIIVDNNQSFAVAHMYDDKMWDLHKFLGYALAFLFFSRIIIEIRQSKEEKMQTRISKMLLSYLQSPKNKKDERHYLIVKYSYLLFYALLLIMVTTGLIIAFGADLGIAGPTRHTIKEVHGFVQYFIYAFVFFHLAGVIYTDITKANGIISGMINGGK
jgi:cytochrome b